MQNTRAAESALVVPLAVDEKESDTVELIRSSGIKNIIFCVDEDYPFEWVYKYGEVVRCKNFGIGKALDLGVKLAYNEGYNWIIRTDNHVRFKKKPYLDERLKDFVQLPLHYTPEGTTEHGLYIDLDWNLVWNHEPYRILPCVMNPVFIIHRDLISILLYFQNKVFSVPYWGKENFDITLSLSRLGYPVISIPYISIVHYYKKEWNKNRIERTLKEDWMHEAPSGNLYFLSMIVGDAVFALRHDWNVEKVPDWAIKIAIKYFPNESRYLNGTPVKELYNLLKV